MKHYEAINHPKHYMGGTPYEHVAVAEAMDWGYAIGSATKYLWRLGRKPGADQLEDLRKAAWWLNHEIERIEREHKEDPQAVMRREKQA